MSDLKVQVGDRPSASKHNRIVDRLPGSTQGASVSASGMSRVEVPIINDSGADLDIGHALIIDTYDGVDATDPYEIGLSLRLECDSPTWHTAIARTVVLAGPIPDSEPGQAIVSGMCLVALSDSDAAHRFVMIDPTDTKMFKTANSGIGRLLAIIPEDTPSDPAIEYGLVILGDTQNLWRYKLTQASQAPSVTTAKLYDRDGTEFAASINLSDPESLMDDQTTDDTGWCIQCGEDFEAIQGPC